MVKFKFSVGPGVCTRLVPGTRIIDFTDGVVGQGVCVQVSHGDVTYCDDRGVLWQTDWNNIAVCPYIAGDSGDPGVGFAPKARQIKRVRR